MAFQILFQRQWSKDLNFDLKVLVANPLNTVPFSIGRADGYLAKTDNEISLPNWGRRKFAENFVGQDGNPVFYYMKLVPESGTRNFIKIWSQVFDITPKTGTFIYSPDSYEPGSVKED